jgi:hypothetical protein
MPAGARPPPGMPPPGAPRPGAPFPLGARPPPPAMAPLGARPPAPRPALAPSPAPVARKDPFGFGTGVASAAMPVRAPEEDFGDIDVEQAAMQGKGASTAPETSLEPDFGAEPAAPELAPTHAFVPPADATGHLPEARNDAGEAALRAALSKASREVIERVVWEVVPQLAETIIRENLDRLARGRQE